MEAARLPLFDLQPLLNRLSLTAEPRRMAENAVVGAVVGLVGAWVARWIYGEAEYDLDTWALGLMGFAYACLLSGGVGLWTAFRTGFFGYPRSVHPFALLLIFSSLIPAGLAMLGDIWPQQSWRTLLDWVLIPTTIGMSVGAVGHAAALRGSVTLDSLFPCMVAALVANILFPLRGFTVALSGACFGAVVGAATGVQCSGTVGARLRQYFAPRPSYRPLDWQAAAPDSSKGSSARCVKCGAEVRGGEKVCAVCGASLQG